MLAGLTVAILAGGQSSRMGTDKSFVRLAGRPLIEHILAQAAGLGDETLIITNQPRDYAYLGVPLFGDVLPGRGALGGLFSALSWASRRHVLCMACDMPYLARPLAEYLIRLAPAAQAVVPRLAGQPEPFRAIYERACLGSLRAALEAGQLKVSDFLARLPVRYLDEAEIDRFDPQHLSFINLNTPAEVEQARQVALQP
jgi:molybdopterin-guanine dinucleotide biosynthesis protein A